MDPFLDCHSPTMPWATASARWGLAAVYPTGIRAQSLDTLGALWSQGGRRLAEGRSRLNLQGCAPRETFCQLMSMATGLKDEL